MPDIKAIQSEMRSSKIDGWLFYDHHHRDPIAANILGVGSNGMATRRFFYFIPAKGEPRKLVHRIEAGALDELPGDKTVYLPWQELEAGVKDLVKDCRRVAMEYSPRVSNPYVSRVDAGVIELVRDFGVEIISSGDLI